jgi:nitrite reductase/ring-hydroxylating ferredoxin subunit
MVKIKACLASELPPGTMRNINLMGRIVLIANVEGKFFAMDGICSSDGGNLADGALTGYVVRCPIHGAEFDLRTGKVIEKEWGGSKKAEALRTYPVTMREGCIYLDV